MPSLDAQRSSRAADLIRIPRAELWEVRDLAYFTSNGKTARRGRSALAARGALTLSEVAPAAGGAAVTTVTLQVGAEVWALPPGGAVVRAGDHTWALAAPAAGASYVVVAAESSEPEALGILDAALEAVSLFAEARDALGDKAVVAADRAAARAVDANLAGEGAGDGARGALVAALTADSPQPLSEGLHARAELTAAAARAAERGARPGLGARLRTALVPCGPAPPPPAAARARGERLVALEQAALLVLVKDALTRTSAVSSLNSSLHGGFSLASAGGAVARRSAALRTRSVIRMS